MKSDNGVRGTHVRSQVEQDSIRAKVSLIPCKQICPGVSTSSLLTSTCAISAPLNTKNSDLNSSVALVSAERSIGGVHNSVSIKVNNPQESESAIAQFPLPPVLFGLPVFALLPQSQ